MDSLNTQTSMTETRKIQLYFSGESTECWAHLHGGYDKFSTTDPDLEDKLQERESLLIFNTVSGIVVIQTQDGCMSLSLGLEDYSPYLELVKDTCHSGTYLLDGMTYIVLIQKSLLSHLVNTSVVTCQKLYQKTPTKFYLRVNCREKGQDMISNMSPEAEDRVRYIEISNFQSYLGEKYIEGSSFQVSLYNEDQTKCLAQVTNYGSVAN